MYVCIINYNENNKKSKKISLPCSVHRSLTFVEDALCICKVIKANQDIRNEKNN